MTSKAFSISLLISQIEGLDELAKLKDRKRNWLIRKAVEEYLKKEGVNAESKNNR